MENVYPNYEIIKEFSSRRPAANFHWGASANKSEKCPSCGRDLSQPNLLPPSISKSCAKPKGFSRGHATCVECGGLGADLLDEI